MNVPSIRSVGLILLVTFFLSAFSAGSIAMMDSDGTARIDNGQLFGMLLLPSLIVTGGLITLAECKKLQ